VRDPHMMMGELPAEVEHRHLVAGELGVEHHQQPDAEAQREQSRKPKAPRTADRDQADGNGPLIHRSPFSWRYAVKKHSRGFAPLEGARTPQTQPPCAVRDGPVLLIVPVGVPGWEV